ncbi:MAG TPA: hypothetical protein VIF62_14920 [Labilithrix sp.]
MASSSTKLLLVVLACASVTGCGALRRLAGNDTVNLEKADVKSMSVDLRRQQKTICPRAPVQMAIFMEVVLDGDKDKKQVETWAGRGSVNKNDKLEFTEFAFHSEQGSFDQDGWFSPNPDVLVTAGKEFEIKSVFRKRPDKFSMNTTYKPDYECIKSGGGGGASGSAGSAGGDGEAGRYGQSGSSSQGGGDGGDGSPGSNGGRGTDGAPGPHLTAYATMVKTPFYDRLVAISIDGDAHDFLLVPEGAAITLHASGGAGGSGGRGGHGGSGGSGGSGNPGGNGGRGAAGGSGGKGGNGGPGGQIDLVYDTRFPDLRGQIHLDVAGGAAGSAGPGGNGGSAGRGGSGITPSGSSGQTPPPAPAGKDGSGGAQGAGGAPGRSGPDGRATASPGDVKSKLSGRGEVTVL